MSAAQTRERYGTGGACRLTGTEGLVETDVRYDLISDVIDRKIGTGWRESYRDELEEFVIVGDHHDGRSRGLMAQRDEILRQPPDGVDVEVIRGLIQQEEVCARSHPSETYDRPQSVGTRAD